MKQVETTKSAKVTHALHKLDSAICDSQEKASLSQICRQLTYYNTLQAGFCWVYCSFARVLSSARWVYVVNPSQPLSANMCRRRHEWVRSLSTWKYHDYPSTASPQPPFLQNCRIIVHDDAFSLANGQSAYVKTIHRRSSVFLL